MALTVLVCVPVTVDTSHFPLSTEGEQAHSRAESCSSQGTEYIFPNTQFTSNSKDRSLLRGQNKGGALLLLLRVTLLGEEEDSIKPAREPGLTASSPGW